MQHLAKPNENTEIFSEKAQAALLEREMMFGPANPLLPAFKKPKKRFPIENPGKCWIRGLVGHFYSRL